MTDDYIKRSDAISAFCGNCEVTDLCRQLGEPCEEVKRIKAIPAADVEPVVRCENCQFFEIVEYWPDGTKKVCQLLKRQVLENCFCCWGMKKEAEDG